MGSKPRRRLISTALAEEADKLVNGGRQDQYGAPEDSFARIGMIFTAILHDKLVPGRVVTPADTALLLAGMKLGREAAQIKADNIRDAHGYLLCYARIAGHTE